MDFFQSQETVRRNTFCLVFLFVLAVLTFIVLTTLLLMVVFGFEDYGKEDLSLTMIASQFDWGLFGFVAVSVSMVVLAGSAYKAKALSAGGAAVAESLGGRLIYHNTLDPHERRALNVVEEMAIASGTPVPPVYLLNDEEGINAFAAGHSPNDAVIGVTRGSITNLTRDELQGVMAHEFSHIFNGDMRLNMRLICILHGILLIGLIGRFLLKNADNRSKKNKKKSLPALSLGLIVLGYSGTFFGNLIKASVNRQREFLADASAVQFTRNKDGISGALKKIGGYAPGSQLSSPGAPSMSHAYFNTGIKSFMKSLMATHPALKVRINRIDPQWDGKYATVNRKIHADGQAARQPWPAPKTDLQKNAAGGAVMASSLLDSVGQISPEQLDYAATLVDEIPKLVLDAVHETYGARAVIYGLVINDQPDIRNMQMKQIEAFGDTGVYQLVYKILMKLKGLDIRYRLPLIDMALPLLRQLSEAQYRVFKKNLRYLIKIDKRIDLFEWSLQKILFHHLDPHFGRLRKPRANRGNRDALKEHINILINIMLLNARMPKKSQINTAIAQAEKELWMECIELLPAKQIKLSALDLALDNLALLKPRFKRHLLKACLVIVTQDHYYAPKEMELMRAFSAVLDCPLPPCAIVK